MHLHLILLLLLTIPATAQPPVFYRAEVLADLDYLRESLEEAHYNLYAYISEQAFDSVFQSVRQSIKKDSFSLLETTTLFQQVVSAANIGHTSIDFPVPSYLDYAKAGGTLFPLEIAFENGQALVRKNCSANTEIPVGSELVSINHRTMDEILAHISPQVSAERDYFKKAKIEMYSFPRLYWQVYGEEKEFEVGIRTNGSLKTHRLKAIGLIEGYESKRTEVLNARMQLKFHGPTAYINPGNFSGDEQQYRQFIDSAFTVIRERKSKHLIVDFRNNGGGEDAFSDYLVSYIADRPFRWHSSFTLKTSAFLKAHVRQHFDTTKTYWQEILQHEDGEVYDYTFEPYTPQPRNKRFKGEVYVLINRQSHSQSAVAAAQIQDYDFGTVVGEETGEYPTLYASIFQYTLPQTDIAVNVSKGYIVRVNGSTEKQGVMPDIYINDHLLDEEDEILDGLLNQLHN